jgi:hypothetical protein
MVKKLEELALEACVKVIMSGENGEAGQITKIPRIPRAAMQPVVAEPSFPAMVSPVPPVKKKTASVTSVESVHRGTAVAELKPTKSDVALTPSEPPAVAVASGRERKKKSTGASLKAPAQYESGTVQAKRSTVVSGASPQKGATREAADEHCIANAVSVGNSSSVVARSGTAKSGEPKRIVPKSSESPPPRAGGVKPAKKRPPLSPVAPKTGTSTSVLETSDTPLAEKPASFTLPSTTASTIESCPLSAASAGDSSAGCNSFSVGLGSTTTAKFGTSPINRNHFGAIAEPETSECDATPQCFNAWHDALVTIVTEGAAKANQSPTEWVLSSLPKVYMPVVHKLQEAIPSLQLPPDSVHKYFMDPDTSAEPIDDDDSDWKCALASKPHFLRRTSTNGFTRQETRDRIPTTPIRPDDMDCDDREVEAQMLLHLIKRFALEGPLMIVLHLHTGTSSSLAMEGESWLLASMLAYTCSTRNKKQYPLLTALVTRPLVDLDNKYTREVLEEAELMETLIQLRPLSKADRAFYLCEVLRHKFGYEGDLSDLDDMFVKFISDRAAGNPKHIEETVNALVETKALLIERSVGNYGNKKLARLADGVDLNAIPPSKKMIATVLQWYENLNARHQLLLKMASTMISFSAGMLRGVFGVDELEQLRHLAEDLARLVENGFLEELPILTPYVRNFDATAKTAYCFQNMLMRHEVHKLLLAEEKKVIEDWLTSIAGASRRSLHMTGSGMAGWLKLRNSSGLGRLVNMWKDRYFVINVVAGEVIYYDNDKEYDPDENPGKFNGTRIMASSIQAVEDGDKFDFSIKADGRVFNLRASSAALLRQWRLAIDKLLERDELKDDQAFGHRISARAQTKSGRKATHAGKGLRDGRGQKCSAKSSGSASSAPHSFSVHGSMPTAPKGLGAIISPRYSMPEKGRSTSPPRGRSFASSTKETKPVSSRFSFFNKYVRPT